MKRDGPENGFPRDMMTQLRSIIYAESKIKVEELTKFREKLEKFYGNKLIKESRIETELVNKIVKELSCLIILDQR